MTLNVVSKRLFAEHQVQNQSIANQHLRKSKKSYRLLAKNKNYYRKKCSFLIDGVPANLS